MYSTSKTLTDCNTKRADKVKNMRNDVMLLLLFLLFFLSFGIPGDRPLKSFISLLLVFLLHFELFESTPGLSLFLSFLLSLPLWITYYSTEIHTQSDRTAHQFKIHNL